MQVVRRSPEVSRSGVNPHSSSISTERGAADAGEEADYSTRSA
jgi:hypothetical protein